MFDISFGELALIGTVALVVIGPEKLPKVARTAGMLFGRAQRMAAGFRADLERELQNSEIAELQKKIAEEASSFQDEMAESAAQVSSALSEPDNRILPPAAPTALPTTPATPAPTEAATPALPAEAEPAKPRRRRKPAQATPEVSEPVAPTATEAVVAEETASAAEPAPKKPRKRKKPEPQADLFNAPPAAPEPTDWGDRR